MKKNRFFPIIMGLGVMLGACAPGKKVTEIVLAPSPVTASFVGNGVQWSAYPHADSDEAEWGPLMTDAKWQRVFDRLDFIKPRLVRVMDQAHWRYYKGPDNNGNPIADFSTQEIVSLCKLLDYCQKNGIPVVIGEWGTPDNGIRENGILRADDSRWSGMICQYLDFLINKKGYTCLKYYNLVNEPNGNWASTDGDWEQWSAGYKMLHEAFVQHGLSDKIALVGPDVVANFDHKKSAWKGSEWVKMTADELADITAMYDVHPYPDQNAVRSTKFYDYYKGIMELTQSNPRPFILGEIGLKYKDSLGMVQKNRAKADTVASDEDSQMFVYEYFYGVDMADAVIQSMIAGYSGAIAWDLDDAMHTQGDTGGRNGLKRWGMWNSLGTEFGNLADEQLRPWFYTWALMCRYFEPEMQIFRSDSVSVQGVRVVAGKGKNGCTVALLNSSEQEREVRVNGAMLDCPGDFKQYLYSEPDSPVDGNGFPVPVKIVKESFSKGGIEVHLPARSFVLYTNIEY